MAQTQFELPRGPLYDLGVEAGERDPRLTDEARNYLARLNDPLASATRALNAGLVVALLVAGLDKFALILTNWTEYLAPIFPRAFGVDPTTLLMFVGGFEIALGLAIGFRARVFGYVLVAWLLVIDLNLLILGSERALLLLNTPIMVGAYALSKLSMAREVGYLGLERLTETLTPLEDL